MKANYDTAFAKIIGVEGGYQSPEQAIVQMQAALLRIESKLDTKADRK